MRCDCGTLSVALQSGTMQWRSYSCSFAGATLLLQLNLFSPALSCMVVTVVFQTRESLEGDICTVLGLS